MLLVWHDLTTVRQQDDMISIQNGRSKTSTETMKRSFANILGLVVTVLRYDDF